VADELEPLSPLAKRAIDAELRRADVDLDMRERVLARVAGTIAFGAAAGVGVAATAKTAAAATASAATAAATGAAGAGAATSGGAVAGTAAVATGITAAKVAPIVIAAFVAGGGAGAVIQSRATTPKPIVPSATVPVAPPAVVPPEVAPRPPATSPPPVATPSSEPSAAPAATITPPPRPSAGNDTDLAAERALVDRARMALARGQPGTALESLDAHARAYPRGRLAEEREAMAVQALAQADRTDEARRRAARFRAAYPKSVFSAVVDGAVGPAK
jgi:hypothetical protein